jgi:two-component system sensor histidine kinase DegS
MKVALISWEGRPAVLNMFTDITEERQLREEKEQFTKKLIKVQEEERNRISRELHDDTAQWLALLTLEMDDIVARGGQLPKDIISRLQKLRETTEKALKEVRRFSHELRPSVLEHFGLTAALELIISEFNTADPAAKTDIRLKITGKDRRLSEEIELVLFRIAQESLSNIRKHSRATRALVSLHYSDETVGLTVTDNGRGFDTGKKTADPMGGGLGLVGMRERANIIGGKFYLRSIPGKRTTVSVRVPIPRTEEN